MNKTLLIFIFMVIFLCACGNNAEIFQKQTEKETRVLVLNDVLTALNDAAIQYLKRAESNSAYDLEREGAERHLFQLESGNLTIYIFSNVAMRREVQRDPFPTAGAVPPNGSYGMDKVLVFYFDGDTTIAQKLKEAFEPLGVEEQSQLEMLAHKTDH
ncbi:hypothetical protein ACFO9Q_20345 [Paenibacillus sp. GCM10023252]|uniref:hypothetical protein n=1 Tax=Paenibacillus sp. GCM10023252 TaxID=3252649 RepID=UPI00362163F8